jgi:hypothetical protein
LQSLFERITLVVQGLCSLFILAHRFVQGCLRVGNCFSAALAFLLLGRLFFGLPALATLAFPFIRFSRFAVRCLVRLSRRLLRLGRWLVGELLPSILAQVRRQFGVLAEAPIRSHGTFETTPGFAIVAAMTSGSVLSFAAPWWKRLLSAPQALSAAFIDGAAIACSKKPSDVW